MPLHDPEVSHPRWQWKFAICGLITCATILQPGCRPPAEPVQEVSVASDDIADATPITVGPHDWAWWRGPTSNNVAASQSAPSEWSDSKNVAWKTKVRGRGHSAPTVVGDRIYLSTADEAAEQQFVVCFDRLSGQQIWETRVHEGGLPGSRAMHPKSTHANGTVACDGTSLFVGFLNNDSITATSLTLDGDIRWQTNLGNFTGKFGYAPSPCLHEAVAIYAGDNHGGAFIAAVHRDTGDLVWRKARNNVDTYSSPIVANIEGRPQLLISGDDRIASYNPMTGEELWSCPGTAEATCGTAVWLNNLVFASGGYPNKQTVCVDASTGKTVWENSSKCYEQSMLIAKDHLFAITDDGIAICWDAKTGDRKWRQRLTGPVSASPVLVGNHIYATNERGTTWVFEADPSAYKLVSQNQLGEEAFASLSVCDSRIYARVATGTGSDRQEYLYCIGEPPVASAPTSE